MSSKPVRLDTVLKEKVWGSRHLSPWYPDGDRQIGEVWFEADLPLLVKFIFTTEKLSVQVHPDDEFAAKHENSRGKTEMWHILRADEDSRIAVGFREGITPQRLREASLSGEIEQLLNWVKVRAGETYFTPAGTVHAIGSGIALCEIQQQSDVTYRLYDYGRPRELHLEKSMLVADCSAHPGQPVALPVDCPHFHTEKLILDRAQTIAPDPGRFELFIFLQGDGSIAAVPYRLGECWLAEAGCAPFEIAPSSPTELLRTWVP